MRKIVYFVLALSVIATGCTDDFGSLDAKPPGYLSVSPDDDIFVTHEGIPYGTALKIKVKTDAETWDWDWDVRTSELWCTTYRKNPAGNFLLTVRANDKSEEREALITVSSKNNAPPVYIKVHQGVTPVLTISPSKDQEMPYGGGALSVGVRSITSWTVESDKSWVTVDTQSGEGDGAVRIAVDPNPGRSPDFAIVTFRAGSTTQKLKIKRAGNPNGIHLSIFQGGYRVVPLSGEVLTISVTCTTSWTVSSDKTWARPETTEGVGNGSARIFVASTSTADYIPANVYFRAGPLVREVNIYRRGGGADPDPDPGHKYKYVLKGYSPEVVYNISGNEIREGYSSRVVYKISGNEIREGYSTKVVYKISGNEIREGYSIKVVYKISGNKILEGYSQRVAYTLE